MASSRWAYRGPRQFKIIFTDEDSGQTLSYTASDLPPGISFNGDAFAGTFDAAGEFIVTVVATDNGVPPLSATNSFTVIVDEVNTPAVLPAQTNRTIAELTPLTVTNTAVDPESGSAGLIFSLDPGFPEGMFIDPTTGNLTWTPSESQGPGTYTIIIRVSDNGIPSLSATRSFTVFVVRPPRISEITAPLNGRVSLSLSVVVGKTYRVEYKNDLNQAAWSPLGGNRLATSATLTIEDDIGMQPQRFYRVMVLD